ncbi:MAG: type IV pilus biogenesis/stability protein PilW [Gammaproteobacteria bacterium]|nr:type IV pilus biogenesis/stability protein PilW [Gammaproteobacteria bacterium]MDH5512671.1 type IV pilus biogenesis/stability protein PilW [Gammaproteobacteria bacterium]
MNWRLVFPLVLFLPVALAGCASSAERQAEQAKIAKLAETHVLLGSGYLQRGQLEIASEELGKALKISPDYSQANNIMAVLQWRLKDYASADRYFRKALASDDNNASAQHNYGAFLCDRGKIDEGLKYFDAAIANQMYSYAADVNLNAGVCLMKKPMPAAAEKYFREALQINPKLPGALYHMAKISLDSGKAISGRAFIERYFQAAEDTPESLLLAVKIERALRNKNAEASYAIRLRGKFPASPEAEQLASMSAPKKN